jgi:hypothetical protein
MRITFGNRLSAQSWSRAEDVLAGESLHPKDLLRGEGLEVDLSAVGFTDFIILGRLLVLIDAFAMAGSPVKIQLPSPQLLEREISHLKVIDARTMSASDNAAASRLALRSRQRGSCRLFMEQSGFEAALAHDHWPKGLVTIEESPNPEYLPTSLTDIDADLAEPIKAPHRRRRILPYQWLKPDATPAELAAEVEAIKASLNGIGLPSEDSALIAYGLISELVENVGAHARSRASASLYPLVGLVVLDAEVYSSRRGDFDDYLHSFTKWSASIPSPIIRVFVGDSGQGAFETAESLAHDIHVSPSNPAHARLHPRQEAILQAMSRWAPSRRRQLPARGLWKVHRIVKGYGGSLTLTAGTATAGHVFGYSQEPETIAPPLRHWLPGTVAECNILAVPAHHRRPPESQLPWTVPIAPAASLRRLRCTSVTLRPGTGLDQGDMDKVHEILQQLHSDSDGLIIAIDIPREANNLVDYEFTESIHDVLKLATEAANPATVSLAFAGANRSLLTLAIENLNDMSPEITGPGLSSPVLVIAEGVHYWAGSTPGLRTILGRLSQAAGPLSRTEFDDVLTPAELHQIHQHEAILQLTDELVTLKLRPQDVVGAMISYFGDSIVRRIEQADGPGVEGGVYLTPTLRYTSRWINARSLLEGLGCLNMAALLLAFLVNDRVGHIPRSEQPIMINLVGAMTRDVTSVFGLALAGVQGDFETITSGSLSSAGTSVAEGQPVIICTDLIRTEHAVRKAVSELLALGASVIAIAALIDARDEVPADHDDHLQVGDRKIPLIRLARVVVSASPLPYDDPGLKVIDPILDEPMNRAPAYAKTMVPHDDYIGALTRSGGARIGHIERPADRHYSAYVDPTRLFTDTEWRECALKSMVARVKAARIKAGISSPRTDPICILLPARTRDAIEHVAHLLEEALDLAGLNVLGILQVPRGVGDGDWIYPFSLPLPDEATHVVILDAGSRNGRTLRQLIRVASTAPVRAITAMVLANGMDDADAIALQQIRIVEDMHLPGQRLGREIRVEVGYLSRTAVKSADAEHCPVCSLQKSYASITLPITDFLAEYHQFLLSTLEVRSKEELFSNQAIDLFGAPIAQADCVAYMTWRAKLRDAFFSTKARAELLKEIYGLKEEKAAPAPGQADAKAATTARDALIRVLAAENYWLDREPLCFEEARRLITGIAASVVGDPPAANADPMLRIQAAVTLARVDPSHFAAEVAAIIRNSADHRLVVAHILLEVVRLITMDGQSPQVVEKFARNMSALEHVLREDPANGLPPAEVDVSGEIKFVAAAARSKLPPHTGDNQHAWAALLRHRESVKKHTYDQPIWRLLVCMDTLKNEIPVEPEDALQDWMECTDGLAKDVLPNLPSLSKYLLSERVTRHFSYWDTARWSEVVAGGGARLLADMTVRLSRILGRPPERIAADPQLIELTADLEWWSRFFFTSSTVGGDLRRDPILLDVIRRCPIELQAVIEEIFKGTTFQVNFHDVLDDSSTRVFCTFGLLADTLTHIRRNAEGKHRLAGAEQEFLITVTGNENDSLTVTVLNTGSLSAGPPSSKGGLSVLNMDLALFGAHLDEIHTDARWTYGISLAVQRWKGM